MSPAEQDMTIVRVDVARFCRAIHSLLAYALSRSVSGGTVWIFSQVLAREKSDGDGDRILRVVVVDQGVGLTEVGMRLAVCTRVLVGSDSAVSVSNCTRQFYQFVSCTFCGSGKLGEAV